MKLKQNKKGTKFKQETQDLKLCINLNLLSLDLNLGLNLNFNLLQINKESNLKFK